MTAAMVPRASGRARPVVDEVVPLEEIRAALATLPDARTPNRADWERLSRSWRPRRRRARAPAFNTPAPPAPPRGRPILPSSPPAYTFERIQTALAPKWSATASHLGVHPWCVVTSDPREFGIHLPATSANGHD